MRMLEGSMYCSFIDKTVEDGKYYQNRIARSWSCSADKTLFGTLGYNHCGTALTAALTLSPTKSSVSETLNGLLLYRRMEINVVLKTVIILYKFK